MSVLPEVLAANKAYAESFGETSELALPPARGFAILTCMDARLDPAKYAGLSEGDAHVIRNAGGRASDDAIRRAAYVSNEPPSITLLTVIGIPKGEGAHSALKGTREMVRNLAMSDATFAEIKKSLSNEHMTDLVLTIAFYCAVVRVLATMQIDNEPYYKEVLQQYPIPGVK